MPETTAASRAQQAERNTLTEEQLIERARSELRTYERCSKATCEQLIKALSQSTQPAPLPLDENQPGWLEGQTGSALAFDDGILNLSRKGSATLVFRDEVLDWERDDESGKDYRIVRLPASEVLAIRDEINKRFPPASRSHVEGQVIELREALEFIADLPDPGAEEERSATFYRVHAAMLKQVAAKAIGRETVSKEAFDWAEQWWNSDEASEAREYVRNLLTDPADHDGRAPGEAPLTPPAT